MEYRQWVKDKFLKKTKLNKENIGTLPADSNHSGQQQQTSALEPSMLSAQPTGVVEENIETESSGGSRKTSPNRNSSGATYAAMVSGKSEIGRQVFNSKPLICVINSSSSDFLFKFQYKKFIHFSSARFS